MATPSEFQPEKKTSVSKRRFRLVVGAFLVLLFLLGGYITWQIFSMWQGQQQVEGVAQALREWESEQYQKQLADIYGGQTPQETLQLYINAVEAGDYELASRYLIESDRETEIEELKALATRNNLNSFLNILKEAENDGEILDDHFRMRSGVPGVPSYFIDFVLYPSGVWKISEI